MKTKGFAVEGTVSGLIGISPRDELEGMMVVQLIAAYNGAIGLSSNTSISTRADRRLLERSPHGGPVALWWGRSHPRRQLTWSATVPLALLGGLQ